MFKFLAKVWMAGEINDYRRERKKRKIEQKRIKKEKRIRNVAEIGMVDEAKKKEWETIQTKLVISALIFFTSLIASLVFIPLFFVALVDIFYMIILAFKYEKIKKSNLRR